MKQRIFSAFLFSVVIVFILTSCADILIGAEMTAADVPVCQVIQEGDVFTMEFTCPISASIIVLNDGEGTAAEAESVTILQLFKYAETVDGAEPAVLSTEEVSLDPAAPALTAAYSAPLQTLSAGFYWFEFIWIDDEGYKTFATGKCGYDL